MNLLKGLINRKDIGIQARATIWYSVCNILQKGISFFVIPIYVRMLTTAEYGKYTVFQSWRDILIVLATLNLYCGIFTKAMVDYHDDRDKYTSCMQGLSTICTLVLLGVYLVAPTFWNSLLDMGLATMLLLFAYYLFYPSFLFWSVRQRVEYRYRVMVCITMLISIITPLVSIALLKMSDLRENAVIWGSLLVQMIVGVFFYVYNFIKGKRFYDKRYWGHALKFNIPLIPHYLSLIVLGQADRIMIKKYCGEDKAGIYSFAYSVSLLMNIFIAAINSSLVPWLYEKFRVKEYKPVARVTNGLCVLVGIMSFGSILIAPEIVRILGTEEYMEAIWVVPVVSLSVYFTFCYGLFSNVEFYYNATGYVTIASTLGAGLNIVLNAIFIPLYGFIAAAYTTLVCYLMFMVMHYFFMKKAIQKKGHKHGVYDIKFISLSCSLLFLLMLVSLVLYNNSLARYSFIFILVLCVCLMKNKIIGLIRLLK